MGPCEAKTGGRELQQAQQVFAPHPSPAANHARQNQQQPNRDRHRAGFPQEGRVLRVIQSCGNTPLHFNVVNRVARGGSITLTVDLLPKEVLANYVVEERHHACAALKTDFPKEWDDLISALLQVRLPKSQILTPGGGKSPIAKGLDDFFFKKDWKKHRFKVEVTVDGVVTLAPTHEVDYFRIGSRSKSSGTTKTRSTIETLRPFVCSSS